MIRPVLLAALVAGLSQAAASQEIKLRICQGDFALCAASSTQPTGKTLKVGSKTFDEGVAVCPVLTGPAIANVALMNNSCNPPGPGKVWSLFSDVTSYPQAPSWAPATATMRTFETSPQPGGGMSNMWSFPCVVRVEKVNDATLADCFGPMNESPWTGDHVPPGTKTATAAPVGAANPVGGPVPK